MSSEANLISCCLHAGVFGSFLQAGLSPPAHSWTAASKTQLPPCMHSFCRVYKESTYRRGSSRDKVKPKWYRYEIVVGFCRPPTFEALADLHSYQGLCQEDPVFGLCPPCGELDEWDLPLNGKACVIPERDIDTGELVWPAESLNSSGSWTDWGALLERQSDVLWDLLADNCDCQKNCYGDDTRKVQESTEVELERIDTWELGNYVGNKVTVHARSTGLR